MTDIGPDTLDRMGVATLDRQHEQLILCLRDLHSALKKVAGAEEVQAVIDGMNVKFSEHYCSEEQCMDAISYHDAEAHKKAHKTELNYLQKLAEDLRNTGVPPRPQVVVALETWYFEHVRTMDLDFAAELKRQSRHSRIAKGLLGGEGTPSP